MSVSITATCNLNCKLCYADCTRKPSPRELTTAEWLKFFRYLVRNDFIQLYIEGGEPLYRPDFNELLRYCGRRLMTLVRTNGTLMTRDTARLWKQLGVGHVFVDVMGATARTHDYFTGMRGSFKKSIAAVRYLVDAGLRTDMVIILNRRTAPELQSYLKLAHRTGAQRVAILRLYPLGRVKWRWKELALSLEEQDAAIAAMCPPRGLEVMQSWHPKDGNCCWQAAAVNPFGDSIGCMYLREYVNHGNIRATPYLDTWRNSSLYKQLRSGDVEESCGDCHQSEGSQGGCRSAAYAFHGRWTAPDPYCNHLNKGVDLRVLPKWLLQKNPQPPGPADPGT